MDAKVGTSIKYRSGLHKVNLTVFAIVFVMLGWLGLKPATPTFTLMSQICTLLYFGFFGALWMYSKNEKTKPLPARISK